MRGRPHFVTAGQPAAGQGVTIEVPGAAEWIPRTIVFTVTCGAAAANRKVAVEYRAEGGAVVAVNEAALVLVANDSFRFAGSSRRGVAEWNTGTDILFPLEPLRLTDACQVVVAITNIQAADQVTAIAMAVEQFDQPEPA